MFQWFRDLLNKSAERRKQKDDWARYYANTAAAKKLNLPLDPGNDPWMT
jgi:hypothetical protein